MLCTDRNGKEINLRPLWDAILDVYAEFVKICERHSLLYCADCGTTLGAVRHKGFIPWDDDFDLEMPRSDYEKFVEVAKSELPKGYAWLDRFNCPTYEHAFGKVIVTDKSVVDRVSSESGMSLDQGIFIDVFPMDGYPNSSIARLLRKFQGWMWEFWPAMAKILEKSGVSRNGALRLWSHRMLADLTEMRAKKYQFGSTELCVSIGVSRWFDDKPYQFKFFGAPKMVPFDRVLVPVQEDAESYLTSIFGDYMQLPPVEQRHPAHTVGHPKSWRLGPM